MSVAAITFKGDSNGMRIVSIFVDKQQGPLAVRAAHRIACNQGVSGRVFDPHIDGIEVMGATAMLYPFVIDHLASVVKSGMANELGIVVPEGVAPDCPALAAMLDDAGFDGRMNV